MPKLFVDVAEEHGSLNITSSYKTLIIFISLADILADLLVLGELTPYLDELLSKLFQHSGLKESDMAYYRENFMEDLKSDTLFQECQSMFGIVD
ncbi:hypothetical protein ES703_46329 [subsurface metagenome]